MTKGKQKKCNKHGYYWVGLCCDGETADDICPGCLKDAAPDLLKACEVAILALTHEPINPEDIEFINQVIAKVNKQDTLP